MLVVVAYNFIGFIRRFWYKIVMAIRVLLNNNLRSIYESVDNIVIELISWDCFMFINIKGRKLRGVGHLSF